jgi:type I restriction enzyme S subunit
LRFPGFHEEWKVEKLGNLMDFKVTNSYSRENLNYENGKVKNIHYGDIHTKFQTLFDLGKENVPFVNENISIDRIIEDYYCKEGDVIFADASEDLNDVGKSIELIKLNNEKLLSGLHTLLARPKKSTFHIGFNGYLFKSKNVRTQIQKEAQGSKVLSISASRVSKIYLTYPSISEQKKICSILTAINERIQTQNKIIKQLESLIKSLRESTFFQKIRFRDEKGNEYPQWKEKRLKEICEIIMGQSPDSTSYNSEGNGLPLIQGNADIKERKTQPRNYTVEITKECKVGDLILTVRAPVGSVARSTHNACIGRGVCALVVNKENNSEYIYQFLINYEPRWISLEQGSTFTAVGGNEIKNIKIYLPSLEEQNVIGTFFSSIDLKIFAEKEILKRYQSQKQYLLKNLFI